MSVSTDAYQVDPHSATWKAVVAWANEQIAEAQTITDAQRIDERDADFARGRLFALRGLLKRGIPSKIPAEL